MYEITEHAFAPSIFRTDEKGHIVEHNDVCGCEDCGKQETAHLWTVMAQTSNLDRFGLLQ